MVIIEDGPQMTACPSPPELEEVTAMETLDAILYVISWIATIALFAVGISYLVFRIRAWRKRRSDQGHAAATLDQRDEAGGSPA